MPLCKKCANEILDDGFMGYCNIFCMGDLSQPEKVTSCKTISQSHGLSAAVFDYHGFQLFEAKNKLVDDVIEAYDMGIKEISIIHGYKHGQAIKAYIWNKNGLLKEIRALRSDLKVKLLSGSSRGKTTILFPR